MLAWGRALMALAFVVATGAGAQTSDLVSTSAFRVCADPANYPMSDEAGTGFENKIAELFAEKLELPLEYTWYPMSTGFVRNNLRANKCDVIIGFAQGHELVQNTNHYYTSAYTIVTPEGSALADVTELSDPRLKGQRIGVVAGTPPGTHMARNGLMTDAVPYQLFSDRRHMDPVGDMLDDLAAGELDAALLWGPLAGPLAQDRGGFTVVPLLKEELPPRLVFRITMGVRLGESVWKRKLNSLIRRNQDDINAILLDAGVPLLTAMGDAVLE